MAPTSGASCPGSKITPNVASIDRCRVARRRRRHVPFHHGRITTTMLPRAFHRVCVVGSRSAVRSRRRRARAIGDRSDGTIRKTRVWMRARDRGCFDATAADVSRTPRRYA